MKEIVGDKRVFGFLLACVVVFGALTAVAWNMPTEKTTSKILGYNIERGKLSHWALMENNSLYGENATMKMYPSKLVKAFVLEYDYRTNGNESLGYTFAGYVKYETTVGNKKYTLWEERLFERSGNLSNGSFSERFVLDVGNLNERRSKIISELGVRRIDAKTFFVAKVGGFEHRIDLVNSPVGVIFFNNVEKVVRKPIYSESVEPNRLAGVDVAVARILFAIPLAITLPMSVYSAKLNKPKRKKQFIECRRIASDLVILNDKNDLKKISEHLDRPIIKRAEDGVEEYVVLDDKTKFVYRGEWR